jgi:hypothetical protein
MIFILNYREGESAKKYAHTSTRPPEHTVSPKKIIKIR